MQDLPPSDVNSYNDSSLEEEPRITTPFPVVGVGGSAGGLEAFSQFLAALPSDTGMAFVLIQHLDPTHVSQLPEILSRTTQMRVRQVADGMLLEPNHVYVIPPNRTLRVAERLLRLSPRPERTTPHCPIDEFFESLALEQGRLSIGIVFSGTGSDGSQGLRAIKSAFGFTFAQDAETAQYAAMPRNAVATGAVDFVLSPAQIASELERISKHRFVVPVGGDAQESLPGEESDLKEFYPLLLRATGVDFSHYKRTTLNRRIGRRMIVHHCDGLPDYLRFIRKHPDELKELYRDLLINVTSFFRNPQAFAALFEHIDALVQQGRIEHSFRAWIPGCSTGEEVYSLAIYVQELFDRAGMRPQVQLFGTDISERALETAREGIYPEELLKEVSTDRLARHFTRVDGKLKIHKSIREQCIFARQDVTRDTPFSHLDLVSCRNMLIYLEPILQQALVPIFHYALNPFGLLFLGSSETIGTFSTLFKTLDKTHKVFSRQPGPARLTQSFAKRHSAAEPLAHVQVRKTISKADLLRRVDRTIQERYAPDSVVISEELEILQFRGHTGSYLEPPAGDASYHILRMARGGLQYALREAVFRSIRQDVITHQKGVRLTLDGTPCEIDLEVIPLSVEPGAERVFLVAFLRTPRPPAPLPPESLLLSLPDEGRVTSLEQQLAESHQYQRGVAEDYEAALEAIAAANEELQTANEELQSSNEELETAREELQSANEELSTVNEELDTRNQQLGALNDDLTNLFGAVNVPILRVDRDLCLRRFTPAAEKFLAISAADLDQPIRDLQSRLGTSLDLESAIRTVTETLTVQSSELRDLHGRWWALMVKPYRTADDRLDGAVLTFTDINSIQVALHASQEARSYADAIIETVREPLVMLTSELRVERANASFYKTFGLQIAQTERQFIYELPDHPWDAPEMRSLLEECARTKRAFNDLELKHTFPEIGTRVMMLNGRQLQLESRPLVLLAFQDITEQRRAEEAVARRLARTDIELDRTKEELRALAESLMHVREEEQRHIARELHDDLLQRLAFLQFQVERFRLGPIGAAHRETGEILTTIEQEIGNLSNTTRNISHRLHPATLDELGLVAALRKLAGEFEVDRKSRVRLTSRVESSVLGRGQFAGTVYRIAQEALQNVRKHAPAAVTTILLTSRTNELHMTIRDAGPGFDLAGVRGAGGLGLINMQERARLLGGTLEIKSKRGQGTAVILRVPIPGLKVLVDRQ